MRSPSKLLFLPGAGGSTSFWKPVSDRLAHPATRTFFGWPGFAGVPADPDVRGIDDLVARVVAAMNRPCALIAQSMGGVIAVRAAAKRPDVVTHLVLAATSGGIDISDLQTHDWRPEYVKEYPSTPRWFVEYQTDCSAEIRSLNVPTLLLWGDTDPISPVAVGTRLQGLLRHPQMHVIHGGRHDFANVLASSVASLIDAHLVRTI
jgi:pimeloyl-ACP methyl ester carboxylesterase